MVYISIRTLQLKNYAIASFWDRQSQLKILKISIDWTLGIRVIHKSPMHIFFYWMKRESARERERDSILFNCLTLPICSRKQHISSLHLKYYSIAALWESESQLKILKNSIDWTLRKRVIHKSSIHIFFHWAKGERKRETKMETQRERERTGEVRGGRERES